MKRWAQQRQKAIIQPANIEAYRAIFQEGGNMKKQKPVIIEVEINHTLTDIELENETQDERLMRHWASWFAKLERRQVTPDWPGNIEPLTVRVR